MQIIGFAPIVIGRKEMSKEEQRENDVKKCKNGCEEKNDRVDKQDLREEKSCEQKNREQNKSGECKNSDSKEKKNSCEKEYCDRIAELEKKLAEAQKASDEYKASWYRTAADFDNFKKRNSEAKANAYLDGKGDVIKSILVIGDNLDRALASAVEEKTREGIELVIKQYGETLKNLGVVEIDPVGETFDPNVHEAVHQVEAQEGETSGTIKQVFKKGYSLNGKMLRYAQVIVIK